MPPAYTCWKSEIVLDSRRGAGEVLRAAVEHHDSEPLRRSINGAGETSGAGADDSDVIDGFDQSAQ